MQVVIDLDTSEAHKMVRLLPSQINQAFEGAINEVTGRMLRDIRVYPPPPPGSKYLRTYRLRASWSVRMDRAGEDAVGLLISDNYVAPYNRWVQDRRSQARIHQGRWQTMQDVRERNDRNTSGILLRHLRAARSGRRGRD